MDRLIRYKARFTISEAALLSGLHRNTIRRLANENKIPCSRDYNNYRIFTPEAIRQLRQLAGLDNEGFAKLER